MPRGKTFNLQKDDDVERVLEMLQNSEDDFSSDDDHLNVSSTHRNIALRAVQSDESSSEDEALPEPVSQTCAGLDRGNEAVWRQKEFPVHRVQVMQGCQNLANLGTPYEYFSKYFEESHYENAVFFTKMYALQKFGVEVDLTVTEMKNFYGCSIIMGCLRYPQIHMYWAEGYRNEVISESISRHNFMKLRNIIHFADTNVPNPTNKLWRIQPVIDLLTNRCNQLATDITSYSIDEHILPFTGRCPARQVIRSKPRPVGLKNLVCATSDGLIVDFEMFQGAGTFPDSGLGHGPSIVLRLTKCLPPGSHLFFDRFFTTIPLLEKLEELGFKATGTIMANRLGKRVHFPLDKTMNRGDMCQFVKDDKIAVVKWCDTKCVTIASSACGQDPISEVNRWVRALKRRIPVPMPAVVKLYNSEMGGVDISDQMMEYYRIQMKTRKWPVKVFFHFLDLAVYNSWFEYRRDAKLNGVPNSQIKKFLNFKLELGEVLAKQKKPPPQIVPPFQLPEGFHGSKYRPHNAPDDIRYDRFDHWPQFVDGNVKRCRHESCESRTHAICQKCKVSLCIAKDKDCFKQYHTK